MALAASSSSAALIAYDSFSDYTNGNLKDQGQGVGWGSNNWGGGTSTTQAANVSSSTNLTHPGVTSSGGGVTAGTNSTSDNMFHNRSLGSAISASGTVYFSFLLQRTGNPSKAGVRIQNSGGTMYAGGGSWDSTSTWELYTRNGGSFPKTSTGIAETTTVTQFVIKMDFTTSSHKAFLFVNPATGSSLANVDADADYTFGTNWDNIGKVQASHVGTSGNTGSMAFDEIRIGTEAADMFGAIPEPSTGLLAVFASSVFLLRRRRA